MDNDALASIDVMLRATLTRDERSLPMIREGLQSGRLVIIRDAFRPVFAQRMRDCLDAIEDWRVSEGGDHGHFRFHHHNIYDRSRFPADLLWCESIFDSDATRTLIGALSGRDCSGPASFSASWYLPGDYSLPHTDDTAPVADNHRQVAWVWHLTEDWQVEWGGDFYWGPAQRSISPSFNTLLLFNLDPSRVHFVSAVSPYARSKRLAINGWWTGRPSEPRPRPAEPEPEGSIEVV